MVERLRAFRGATELSYSSAKIVQTSDAIIDSGSIRIIADSSVSIGSVIDFTKKDGSTVVFSPKVVEKSEVNMWDLKLMSNGYELQNLRVEQVYQNKSPEYIVEDIITNYTSLTYVAGPASGVTIAEYIAKDYALTIIKDMMDTLQWQLRIDSSDNVYFQPKGYIDNGVTFTNGVNIAINSFTSDNHSLMNHIKLIGGFENYRTTEEKTGTDTVFSLDKKPSGTMRITVGGVEIAPADYSVDVEGKEVTFTSSQTDPIIDYSYSRPIVVENQNDISIAQYSEIFKEIQAPWLTTSADARKYLQNLLDVYSVPLSKASGMQPRIDFTTSVGEYVTVNDPIRSKSAKMIITKKTFTAENSSTTYEFGPRVFVMYDWQREVQDRIKNLERRTTNITESIFARVFRHNLEINLTVTNVWEQASPVDSFILGHKTLGRLRSGLDFEADCSDSSHPGTWTGTGVTVGSQYTTSGWRLSAGQFNGTDRIVTVTDHSDLDLSSDFTIVFSLKVSSLPGSETYVLNKWDGTDGYAVRIASDNKVELIYSNGGVNSTIKAATALTANVFQHIAFVKNGTDLTVYINGVSNNTATGGASAGTNSNNLIIGKYINYFSGFVDELRIYNDNLSATDINNLYSKQQVMDNCKCYMSFDNPRLGDRISARTPI